MGEKVLKNQQNEKDVAGAGSLSSVPKKAKPIMQQPQSSVAVPLEAGKKDKRRGASYMKQNGFFGVEGELYSGLFRFINI